MCFAEYSKWDLKGPSHDGRDACQYCQAWPTSLTSRASRPTRGCVPSRTSCLRPWGAYRGGGFRCHRLTKRDLLQCDQTKTGPRLHCTHTLLILHPHSRCAGYDTCGGNTYMIVTRRHVSREKQLSPCQHNTQLGINPGIVHFASPWFWAFPNVCLAKVIRITTTHMAVKSTSLRRSARVDGCVIHTAIPSPNITFSWRSKFQHCK